jgi:hypothetical protein
MIKIVTGKSMSERILMNRQEMAARLMESWFISGVSNIKNFIVDDSGWETGKDNYQEYYICDICEKSTLNTPYDEIGYGFSHSICIEEHEKEIEHRLGPIAQVPYGATDNINVESEEELVIEESAKKADVQRVRIRTTEEVPNMLNTAGIRAQMQTPPEGDVCEFIYHSNDNGETIYRTTENSDDYELVEDWQYELKYVIGDRAAVIVDTGWVPDTLKESNQ